MDNQETTIQRHLQHWVHNTWDKKTNKTNKHEHRYICGCEPEFNNIKQY